MRVTDINIKNYRAFYGDHHISLDKDGKNLMVYGENGSGKSSLYAALQLFFKASIGKVDVEENIFVPVSQKNTASIKLTIREDEKSTATQEYELNIANKEIVSSNKTLLIDANKIKAFFDYKRLLDTHIRYDNDVNIFEILIENILYHAENRFTTNEIGKDWENIIYESHEVRQGHWVVKALKENIQKFNDGFSYLIQNIETDTNTFLSFFDSNIKVQIEFDAAYYEGRREVYGNDAVLRITYAGTSITKHQFFLNEARLSALAISLYLASVRANPLSGALKIIVLDDLLIGLDMSNRLPLLKILKQYFIEVDKSNQFQIVMTTYDKVWFELVNNYFGDPKWKYVEIYSKKLEDKDFEIPIIKDSKGYIQKAKQYLSEKDNKASAVYIRTEFERIVKKICEKKTLQVVYKTRQKEFTTEDFWDAIKQQTNLDEKLIKEIEIHRGVVMNPFSHYDLEKPEFERELIDTIDAIEKLEKVVLQDLKKITLKDLFNSKSKLLDEIFQIKKLFISDIIKTLLQKR